jgi:hypothetical protein
VWPVYYWLEDLLFFTSQQLKLLTNLLCSEWSILFYQKRLKSRYVNRLLPQSGKTGAVAGGQIYFILMPHCKKAAATVLFLKLANFTVH